MANGTREDARQIAEMLRSHRDELIDRWIELAQEDVRGVPRARDLDREGLVDFVPALLENVATALERIDPEIDSTVAARDDGAAAAAVRHAEHRLRQGYTITEVLCELGHFRVAMLELCGKNGKPLVGPAGRLAHALIDHAIARSADTIEQREHDRMAGQARRAEDLARAKDDFISLVSHELRSPLNAILGWAQLGRARPQQDTTIDRALETIERNAVLQARLIDDLIDFARLRSRKLRLELHTIDALEAVRSAIDALRPSAIERHVELVLNVAPGVPRVIGDIDRLHQIFANLLTNAVKSTPENGRIEVEAKRVDGMLKISVEDDGQGIPEALLPEIFEPFRQGDVAAGKRNDGLGLGLALVRQLVELHGGRVSAESRGVGKGATFVVELPVAPGATVSARA